MTHLATVNKQSQFRCDYGACGKTFWRAWARGFKGPHFCEANCRRAQRLQAEKDAADERLRILNLAYGVGVLCGVLAISTCQATGACREQHLRGVIDGRSVRQQAGAA